jgi:hypothetical protein
LTPDVPNLWYGQLGALRAIVLGLTLGVSSAATFWIVAVRGSELER